MRSQTIHQFTENFELTEKPEHLDVMLGLRTQLCSNIELHGSCYISESTRKSREYAHHDCYYYHTFMDRRRCPVKNGNCEAYRPALCKSYNTKTGICDYGPNCVYAHGYNELLFHPAIYKTKLCKYTRDSRFCPAGVYCCYAHNEQDKRTPSEVQIIRVISSNDKSKDKNKKTHSIIETVIRSKDNNHNKVSDINNNIINNSLLFKNNITNDTLLYTGNNLIDSQINPYYSDNFSSDTYSSDTYSNDAYSNDTYSNDTYSNDNYSNENYVNDNSVNDSYKNDNGIMDNCLKDIYSTDNLLTDNSNDNCSNDTIDYSNELYCQNFMNYNNNQTNEYYIFSDDYKNHSPYNIQEPEIGEQQKSKDLISDALPNLGSIGSIWGYY